MELVGEPYGPDTRLLTYKLPICTWTPKYVELPFGFMLKALGRLLNILRSRQRTSFRDLQRTGATGKLMARMRRAWPDLLDTGVGVGSRFVGG